MAISTPSHSSERIKPSLVSIEWAFNKQALNIEVFPVTGNPKVLVNLHGTFGSRRGGSGKYLELAEAIQSENLASTVLYDSSRDWSQVKEGEMSYDEKQSPFVGKTFEQELGDARITLEYIIQNSKSTLWVDPNNLEITLHGNSLGWVLAFYLANEYPQVKNIITIGTGLRSEKWVVPILDTFPEKETILEQLWAFKGKYYMSYGTKDTTFNQESFNEWYDAISSADKGFWRFIGVDHGFWAVDWTQNNEVFQQVITNAELFLRTGNIATTEFTFSENPSQWELLIEKIDARVKSLTWWGWEFMEADPHEEIGL